MLASGLFTLLGPASSPRAHGIHWQATCNGHNATPLLATINYHGMGQPKRISPLLVAEMVPSCFLHIGRYSTLVCLHGSLHMPLFCGYPGPGRLLCIPGSNSLLRDFRLGNCEIACPACGCVCAAPAYPRHTREFLAATHAI